MIMVKRRGFDEQYPGNPLSQTRELLLVLEEDSYYKTSDEIETEFEQKNEEEKLD